MLERALLVPTVVRAFIDILREDAPPNSLPRLPQLNKAESSQSSFECAHDATST
jgi:hypothetical protein